ncbi:MAG: hypothetical protein JO322_05650 [Candidatus Eremiobacteraeota bacterium]|nr:hypothetical protein [Candidatus Eremiobacteraeota bacterium]
MDDSFGSSTARRLVEGSRALPIAAALAASVFFVHVPDFFRTIVSANEGLYAVVARELLNGHLPYVTAWEAKPPLFFVLIAAAMRVGGVSFAPLHALSLLAGFCTAYCIYRIGIAFGENGARIGFFAAVLTVALSAANKGTSVEAEVLINAFASAAFAVVAPCVTTRSLTLRSAFIAALLGGCALEMKITALPTTLVAAAFATFATSGALALPVVFAGVLAPVVAGIVPYLAGGRIDAYIDANIGTVMRRGLVVAHPQPYEIARWEFEAFFPVWLLAPLALERRWNEAERSMGMMVVAWLAAAFVSLVAVREFFSYHFITLTPPLCLLAAWGFFRTWTSVRAQRVALAIAILTLVGHGIGRYMTLQQPDGEAPAAAATRQLIAQHPGSLYVAEGDPALYILTNEPIPTRFPYPQHLYAQDMQIAAHIDGIREVHRIFETHPRYVALRRGGDNTMNVVLHLVYATVDRRYAGRASAGEYTIYELRDANTGATATSGNRE